MSFNVKYNQDLDTQACAHTCSLAFSHGTQQTGRNLVALARLDKHLSHLWGESRLWAVSRADWACVTAQKGLFSCFFLNSKITTVNFIMSPIVHYFILKWQVGCKEHREHLIGTISLIS